ncbi:thioredoxin domain-containing protein [Nocardioides sp. ChNu-153]|uniref:DsbA family protein n=1 Tax=unclassified Nocardioides TaxID=2615069 RepID=UPI0024051F0C|nr:MULTISPECIES: thioredoxin domain-containing protein [unclassified Nocardioides]MDF9716375.1 DsbA family protein [Nocardioides sp. ChNu-99]MDN7122881.1 thioredoxin domain-containing protein [Nocardioides sp. ChNu-153]
MAKPASRSTESAASRAAKAAAARREAQRKERLREIGIVVAVVGVVAAIILAVVLLTGGDDGEGDATAPGVGSSSSSSGTSTATDGAAPGAGDGTSSLTGEVTDDYGIAFGDPDAEHRVVIYEDFLCPFCGQLERETTDDLTQLVDSGQVVVEYRAFNLLSRIGDYSERAANAFAVVMDTAGPDAAKAFHDLLFANQPAESGALPDDDWLVDMAVAAGADEEAVRSPIESLAYGDWVAEATDAASDNGVQGTPTVRVDGEDVGGATVSELGDAIFEAVGGRP